MKNCIILLILLLLIYFNGICFAERFPMIGARQLGMGGAFVGFPVGTLGAIYNPAGLSFIKGFDFMVLYGDRLLNVNRYSDLVRGVRRYNISDAAIYSDPIRVDELVAYLEDLAKNGTELFKEFHYGFLIGGEGFSLGVMEFEQGQSYPRIDLDHIAVGGPVFPSSITHNDSRAYFSGFKTTEYILSFSSAEDKFIWGFTSKYVRARTYYDNLRIWDLPRTSIDWLEGHIFKENESIKGTYGFDLGILMRFLGGSFGAVWRYLNKPKFNYKGEKNFIIKPQVRIGYAYTSIPSLIIAIDFDASQNRSNISNFKAQTISTGVEKIFSKTYALRLGFQQNVGESNEDPIYSCGFGISLKGFLLDFATNFKGGISERSTYFTLTLRF